MCSELSWLLGWVPPSMKQWPFGGVTSVEKYMQAHALHVQMQSLPQHSEHVTSTCSQGAQTTSRVLHAPNLWGCSDMLARYVCPELPV